MTEPIQNDPATNDDDDTPPTDEFRGDVVLRAIVKALNTLNDSGSRLPVSLTTGAGTMSGDLIGFGVWQRELDEHARGGNEDPEAVTPASYFEGTDVAEGEPAPWPWHIHLADATLHTGAGKVGYGFWRGRLEQLTGWSPGKP
ncbi:hypothetical protein [Aeromicrobium massiliense]|uniref:hypothetical protein n=1 Tax=Aeromicrobium massiliense TaxID=1464554 RepID=UPI0002DEFD82|nr:hypothetical protein [Aeromicrobium massiliense]